jgi:hypothetical protein
MHVDTNVVSAAGDVPGASQSLKAYFFLIRQREVVLSDQSRKRFMA